MAPRVSGDIFWRRSLPSLVHAIPGEEEPPWRIANRVWISQDIAASLQSGYQQEIRQRFSADAAPFERGEPDAARDRINSWIGEATAGLLDKLLPPGSIASDTTAVLTSAIHFKSPWDEPFDPARTAPGSFILDDGTVVQVPTMTGERTVRMGTVSGIPTMELPFKGREYSLVIALASPQVPLAKLLGELSGSLLMNALESVDAVRPVACLFTLPKFTLPGETQRLKPALQALGVRTVFGAGADFSPMLGEAGGSMQLSEVFHGASVTVDETGGEAAAATAGTVAVKSMQPKLEDCRVDRPFVFAILHRATGTVLFLGRVARPAAG